MTIWQDNAAAFASQAEGTIDAQRHSGVREALDMLLTYDRKVALSTLARSVERQARIAGCKATLPVPVTLPPRGEPERPFTALCCEAEARAAMTNEQFWSHVADHLEYASPLLPADHVEDFEATAEYLLQPAEPCSECGEVGACGFDFEGRALIHTRPVDDDE